jgi:uncharacterized membrane protein YdjX (TVP38/TMEM64 family)
MMKPELTDRSIAGDLPPTMTQAGTRAPLLRFAPVVVILAGLAFGYAMGWHEFLTLDYLAESRIALKQMVEANRLAAFAIFIAVYILATAFSFPAASFLTITGGFLFGWLPGAAAAIFAATIGAAIVFLAARSAFGDFLRRRIGGRAARLARGFEENAFLFMIVLRVAPVFPFFIMNIVPALFNVRFRTYVAATFLGIIPGGLAYSYLGRGLDSVIVSTSNAGRDIALSDIVTPEILGAFAALAVVAAIPSIVKRLRGGGIA